MDFFGLVLLSLSVCLPDVFLDGRLGILRLVNGLFGALCATIKAARDPAWELNISARF